VLKKRESDIYFDILIVDAGHQRIRVVDGYSSIISSVAGNGIASYAGK
jgi:hypothetical protein